MGGVLKDIVDFKLWEGKKVLGDIAKKPSRLLTGVDPWSTNVWNKVKGSDDKPIVDQMGGTTKANMSQMDREGMNTSPGRRMEDVAHVVAAFFGAKGLANIGGGGAGGASGAGSGGASNASNPALIESAVGNPEYGFSSASPGYSGAASAGGSSWDDLAQQQPAKHQEVQREDEPVADAGTVAQRLAALQSPEAPQVVVTSSREKKGPPRLARMGDVIQRGASGQDPYSVNGVEIGAIKALAAKLDALEALARRKGIDV